METIITIPPQIIEHFSRTLLSSPDFGFTVENLRKMADWLLKKINSTKFKKHPNKQMLLIDKYNEFMELYERAKEKERNNEKEKTTKTIWPFYRPRFTNRHDQRLFERLERKIRTCISNRRNNAI